MNLNLKNFRCHESLDWQLNDKPVALLLGQNEAGKSSIRQAIEFALRDKVGYMKKKDRQQRLVRHGARSLKVALKYKEFEIERTLSSCSAAPADIQKTFGKLDDGQRAVALNSYAFLSMGAAERKALMLDVLGEKDMSAKILAALIAEGVNESSAAKVVEKIVSDGWKKAEEVAVQYRRQAGRDIKTAEDVKAPEAEKVLTGMAESDSKLKELENALEEGKADRDKLVEARGAAMLGKGPEELKALIKVAELDLAKCKAADPGKWTAEAERAEKDAEDYARKAKKIEKEIDAAKLQVEEYKAILNALDKAEGGMACPTIPGLSCTPSPEQIAEIQAATIEGARKLTEEIKKRNGPMQAAYDMGRQRAQTAQKVRARIESDKNDGDRAVDIADKLTDLRAQLKLAEATDLDKINTEIDAIDTRMNSCKEVRGSIQTYLDGKQEYEAAQRNKALAEGQHALYDKLAGLLAPDGIQGKLAKEAGGAFFERVTETAAKFLGRELRFDDDTWALVLGNIHEEDLSRSTRLAVGVLVQDAICQALKFPLLLVDDVDTFLGERRSEFFTVLQGIKDDYGRIVVFAATKGKPDGSFADWLQVYELMGGKIEAVGG